MWEVAKGMWIGAFALGLCFLGGWLFARGESVSDWRIGFVSVISAIGFIWWVFATK